MRFVITKRTGTHFITASLKGAKPDPDMFGILLKSRKQKGAYMSDKSSLDSSGPKMN